MISFTEIDFENLFCTLTNKVFRNGKEYNEQLFNDIFSIYCIKDYADEIYDFQIKNNIEIATIVYEQGFVVDCVTTLENMYTFFRRYKRKLKKEYNIESKIIIIPALERTLKFIKED